MVAISPAGLQGGEEILDGPPGWSKLRQPRRRPARVPSATAVATPRQRGGPQFAVDDAALAVRHGARGSRAAGRGGTTREPDKAARSARPACGFSAGRDGAAAWPPARRRRTMERDHRGRRPAERRRTWPAPRRARSARGRNDRRRSARRRRRCRPTRRQTSSTTRAAAAGETPRQTTAAIGREARRGWPIRCWRQPRQPGGQRRLREGQGSRLPSPQPPHQLPRARVHGSIPPGHGLDRSGTATAKDGQTRS